MIINNRSSSLYTDVPMAFPESSDISMSRRVGGHQSVEREKVTRVVVCPPTPRHMPMSEDSGNKATDKHSKHQEERMIDYLVT